MNYQEVTMWLTVVNSIIIAAGGGALCRYIHKHNREPRPGSLDELWRDFAAKHQKQLSRIVEKTMRGEKVTENDYKDKE